MIRETHEFMSGDEIRDDRTVRTRDTGYARVVVVSPGGAVQEEEDAIGIGPGGRWLWLDGARGTPTKTCRC